MQNLYISYHPGQFTEFQESHCGTISHVKSSWVSFLIFPEATRQNLGWKARVKIVVV